MDQNEPPVLYYLILPQKIYAVIDEEEWHLVHTIVGDDPRGVGAISKTLVQHQLLRGNMDIRRRLPGEFRQFPPSGVCDRSSLARNPPAT